LNIIKYITKVKSRNIKNVIRGYQRYNSENNKQLLKLKELLTITPINLKLNRFYGIFHRKFYNNEEIIIRQYMLIRIAGISLNKAILSSIGSGIPMIYPIPPQWCDILRKHGVKISKISNLLWYGYIFSAWLYGVYKFFLILSISIIKIKNSQNYFEKPYIYFNNLTSRNLPIDSSESFDIISWYKKNQSRLIDSVYYAFSIKNLKNSETKKNFINIEHGPLPNLRPIDLPGFISRSIFFSLAAFISIFFGNWANALMLNQTILAIQAVSIKQKKLAKEYLFHNSGWIYRPLWTYVAEKYGSRIILYFYSTNIERIAKKGVSKTPDWGLQAMNWPEYLVWDIGQKNFIKLVTKNTQRKIHVAGPVWFEPGRKKDLCVSCQSISAFDVTPVRKTRHCILDGDVDYYCSKNNKMFLSDLNSVFSQTKLQILYKPKRNINAYTATAYKNYINSLKDGYSCFKFIDPDINAINIILKSHGVVSMPFTSTAIIAKFLGIPSVYYDPTSSIPKNDPAAHKVQILHGIDELREWGSSIVSNIST